MGMWTLESLYAVNNAFGGTLFGTNFHAHFRLRYTPSMFGRFVETPRLVWDEKIQVKEHHKNEWWEFETNMYEHNPFSKTLEIWPRRYIEAYNHATGRPVSVKGSSRLFNRHGQSIRKQDLEQNIANPGRQADAIRTYLQKNGGILLIEIHDIPSINVPGANEHKERLLTFDCGMAGSGLRLKAQQYLDVNAATPQMQWTNEFDMPGTRTWDNGGLQKVPPPPIVSMPRPALFKTGECW